MYLLNAEALGAEISRGFCSSQMLPLITVEWPLKEKPWDCSKCRQRPIRYPCERYLKIFSFLFSLQNWIRFGGVIVCHYLNLRVEAKYEGINVAFSPSQEHLHLYTASPSFIISKLGTVMQGTMAAAPQHCGFNAISVSIKSSIICLWLPKFNNRVQMWFHLC